MAELAKRYGDWALVTGASAGIGEAYARRLAAEGLNVALVARRGERLARISEELAAQCHVQVLAVPLDLTSDDFLETLAREIGDRPIGILVNNAGVGLAGDFAAGDAARQVEMVRLNCLAPVRLAHHFVGPMLERGRGAILFLSSVVAAAPIPWFSTYSASKAFNLFLGEALWEELRGRGVDVLAVCPGSTRSEFHAIAEAGGKRLSMREPDAVVESSLRALGRRPRVVDGTANRVTAWLLSNLPRRLALRVAGRVMRKRAEAGRDQSS